MTAMPKVRNLTKPDPVRGAFGFVKSEVRAVADVSFSIEKGGVYLPANTISNTLRDSMLARGLVTPERLRARGVR